MKNFQQRMDEIHSRSKARIARRRKIAAACVPLVLCFVITGIYFIPYNTYATADTTASSASGYYASITVTMREVNGNLVQAKPDSAEEFIAYVSSLSVDSSRLQSAEDIAGHAELTLNSAPAQTFYQITVTDSQGVTFTYTLEGTILLHKDSGTEYRLNSIQKLEILKLLGLG